MPVAALSDTESLEEIQSLQEKKKKSVKREREGKREHVETVDYIKATYLFQSTYSALKVDETLNSGNMGSYLYEEAEKTGALSFSSETEMVTVAVTVVVPSLAVMVRG